MEFEDLGRRHWLGPQLWSTLAWMASRLLGSNLIRRGGIQYRRISLQLSHFRAISIHLVTGTRPIFVDKINDQRRVTIYQEAFNAKFDGNTETMETSFVLGRVIGG